MELKRICVFCGSSPGHNSTYQEYAKQLGLVLAEKKMTLVYGGSNIGLMGQIAKSVVRNGGRVIGVIPRLLVEKEVAFEELSDLRIVDSMHERKATMEKLSDGFIAMPGGFGTLEETIEMLTWAQLGFHEKPCGLLNIASYYDHLFAFLEEAVRQQFVKEEYRPMIMMDEAPDLLLDRFSAYRAPKVRKWIGAEET